MMKHWLFRISTVLIAVLALSSCGPKAESKPEAAEIKIGWLGALSGDQAVWGTAERNGTLLMIEKINKAGGILGRQLKLVDYDDKGDQLEAVNVAKRLITEDKVAAIIGTNSSGRNIAIAPIAEKAKVPVIATYATNPRVTQPTEGELMQYTFRVCFTDPYQGSVMADFSKSELKAAKAAVLYEISSDYSVGVAQYFRQRWKELGGELVADEAFKTGDVEFRAQLTKIREAKPDVIIMPFLYKEVALATKQARGLGIQAVFIGGDGWPSSELLKMAADAVEGSFFVDHTDVNMPQVQDWRTEYKARFGKDFEVNAIMAHDAVLVLQAAIEKAGTADPEKIAAAMTMIDPVAGYTGNIKIDPKTHNPTGKAAAIMGIKDGKFGLHTVMQPMQ